MNHCNTDNIPVRLLILLTVMIIPLKGFAQETLSCAEKLKSAQTAFSIGQVDQIPSLLSECLKSGFKKEEELAAYKLFIQTYLLNDKLEQADSSMLAFLKRNPEYKLSPTDHSSFVYLYNNFNVRPLMQLSIRIGANLPFLTFVDENLTAGEPGNSEYKSNLANLFISLDARVKVSERIELGAGAGFSQVTFTNNVDYFDFGRITYTETQQRIEIPVSATYDFAYFGRFTTYARAGLGVAVNISTSADAALNMVDRNNPNSRTGETLKRNDSRIPIDIFGTAGVGLKFKISRGFVFFEARTNLGFLEQNVPGGEFTDLLENYYFWSDPGFRLNTFNMNLGYTYIFYKAARKKDVK